MAGKRSWPSTDRLVAVATALVWVISIALIALFHPILVRSFERLEMAFLRDMWFVPDTVIAETFPAGLMTPSVLEGDPCEFEATAERLLNIEPHSELRLVLCRCWEERNEDARAQGCYDHILTQFDNANLGAYEGLARLYVKRGEPRAAVEVVDQGLRVFEDRERKYRIKGEYYAYTSEAERALAVYYGNVEAVQRLTRLKQQLTGGSATS
jgi:hypothetical protein